MTMTLELPQEFESRLREMADREGLDMTAFVKATLEQKLAGRAAPNGGGRKPLFETATMDEINRALDEIAARNQGRPVLPPEALDRESLYDQSV